MQPREKTIRLIIADDHLIVREGLRLILEGQPDFTIAADAVDGATAVRLAEELQPDVMLMDLRMPGIDGLQAIEQIRGRWPHIAIVILTTYDDDELMLRGLRAGAAGYLIKDTGREALYHAIRAAARGETLISTEVMSRLLSHATVSRAQEPGASTDMEITAREREVLEG
ncbi:MAG: response regulator transcription factor, partial [Ktedonobacteraceae bacterium]|nr:response regulator transcription factor [Ktedonobacteraceae bacterium]